MIQKIELSNHDEHHKLNRNNSIYTPISFTGIVFIPVR